MRIGLIGNGYWARVTHAAGLHRQPAVTFAGVWGRDPAKSDPIVAEYGVTAYAELQDLFDDVDAVAFSVPPQVQAELALTAARQGKHLLLEKPIALSGESARRLEAAVSDNDLACLVFFTSRFDPGMRAWVEQVAATSGWDGASGLWLGSAFGAGSPFDTPWRHEQGGLWDVAPHALSLVAGCLGPITDIVARPGPRDLVQLLMQHRSGAVSSYAVSIDTPGVCRNNLVIWGDSGAREASAATVDPPAALAAAAGELAQLAARQVREHPCGVRFGREVVELLERAQAQLNGASGSP
ncbi:MAG TPA: Gfo/Idh/MocA family oxidoreductase [Jatrophihabitans sp.]|nr:Gfo/Idh/MocA family oxidoreductase [Jatrophihabitans sp.]